MPPMTTEEATHAGPMRRTTVRALRIDARRVRPGRRAHRAGAVGLAVVCALMVSCTAGGPAQSGAARESDGPVFSGPYAAEFASAYADASSEFVRDVLRDEQITDAELAETRERFIACFAGVGYEATDFQPDGAFSLTPPPGASQSAVSDVHDRCSDQSGESSVGALHAWLRRNPENLDGSTIMAACLVRAGAVDPGYTAEQYRRDWEADTGPMDPDGPGDAAFRLCNADPLDILS